MLGVPGVEANVGIEVYASTGRGIGGVIKRTPEDFIVEEVLVDGSEASIRLEGEKLDDLAEHGRYLICILVKRGWDTLLAIEEVAKALGITSDRVGFAGIKDAEALTAQYISIGGVPASRVAEVNINGLAIKPLGFSSEKITPMKLFGNRFTITVRSVKLGEKTVRRRIQYIARELEDFGGIPNYFGHQRFGTIRPITHLVGKYIVKGDFENAMLTFLTYVSPFENPRVREVRRELRETMDFKRALKSFPEILIYERLALMHLSKRTGDYVGAFHKLPVNLRKLFVQSYQSYLFNRFLSTRIKRGIPLKEAQVGDYSVTLSSGGLPTRILIMVEESNISSVNEAIKEGKMALALPLIGPGQSTSKGVQGEIEREILEEEGVSEEDFKRARIIKVDPHGGFRTALEKIVNFKAGIISGENSNEVSVKFRFTLHKGTYATIVLREFMKPKTDKELIESGF